MGEAVGNGSRILGKRKFIFALVCVVIASILVYIGKITSADFSTIMGYISIGFLGANGLVAVASLVKK